MHYNSKPVGLTPADFLLEITGIKIDKKELFISKWRWIEGSNSKNDGIGMFVDCFFIDFDGFSDHSFTQK